MIRTLNFICLALTGLVCLGLYHFAEEARIAKAEFRATTSAIYREHDSLIVLGAEWARITQPGRIAALAAKHLDLVDRPTLRLSSFAQLPAKMMPAPEGQILTAKAVLKVMPVEKPRGVAFAAVAAPVAKPTAVAFIPTAPVAKPASFAAGHAPESAALKLRAIAYAPIAVQSLPAPRTIAFTPSTGR